MSRAEAGPADYARLSFPHPFRRHQAEALDALDRVREQGRRRAWVVLPPGAGKTLVGLETIRREGERRGARTVVLSPNTAIQGQWVRSWGAFVDAEGGSSVRAGTDRTLRAPVTALTYQSLAVFDTEAGDPADDQHGEVSELSRLHPNGRALVDQLKAAGPLTLVLDECHHLLEVWGRLLSELLDELPGAVVLGLTATPPATLTADQASLVGTLFGDIVYAATIPAVVREGHLAPFADLLWLTTPTAAETTWLAEQSERFAELTTALIDPSFGSVPFLHWADRRFTGETPFHRLAAQGPELADAALRLVNAGLLALPDGAVLREQHDQPPSAEDWAALIDTWYDECLAESEDDRDLDVRTALRRALPAVGYQLTRRGIRKGRTSIDRVLALSESKAQAMVEIVTAEHRTLGDDLAMLVICDHEAATATLAADLHGVLDERAGSSRAALAALLADPGTAELRPVMVTGRTVAAAPDTLVALRRRVDADLVVGEPDSDGIAELTGDWSSRTWVRAVTDHFTDGACQVLIGTRALLGEGWDAPRASGLVDLSMASTPGTVVQTRGRTLRLNPGDPDKVAINWTVACVQNGHPRGSNDWGRAVAKHRGYFGVDDGGDVVDGVAHIHPSFSPHVPPDAATFGATNAAMLVRAESRPAITEAWQVGTPYDDEEHVSIWLRPARALPAGVPAGTPAETAAAGETPTPPRLTLGPEGLRARDEIMIWRWRPSVLLAFAAALLLLAPVLGGAFGVAVGLLPVVGALAVAGVGTVLALSRRLNVLGSLLVEPDLVQVACAVADGMRGAGLSEVGAESVDWHIAADGRLRVVLEATGEASAGFAAAMAELTTPIGAPRYLVPRYLAPPPTMRDALRPLEDFRPSGVVWHQVPSLLGTHADRAAAFSRAWETWLGGGPAVYTGNPEGAGALAACRGTNPLDATSVLRLTWS